MSGVIEITLMENTSSNSNKFYEVSITQTNNNFYVLARWGKRSCGDTWKVNGGRISTKWSGTNLLIAKREKNKLVRAKKSKGYVEIEASFNEARFRLKKKKEKSLKDISLERFSMLDI